MLILVQSLRLRLFRLAPLDNEETPAAERTILRSLILLRRLPYVLWAQLPGW
jgi:hypothetical protein